MISRVREFVNRGFAVIVPMRRGYGHTGGDWAERYGSCATPDYYRAGEQAATDVLAATAYASALSWVDRQNIVLVGQSAGGFASIAAASHRPPGVVAVVNLSGGRGGNPRARPGEPCASAQMAETISRFARTIRVPVLWHYAENDQYYSAQHVRAWFAAFEAAGAPPQIADQPAKPVVLNKYNVSVVVKPEARFQIDRLGWGPPSGKIEEGVHRLEAIGPGFPIVVERFKLRRDTTITVDLAVRSAGLVEGDLRVSAKSETGEFPPCQVKINGREAGLLPGLRLPLRTGAYEIELVPPGNLQVDSLQFEGDSFEGSRARIKVPPASRSFARFFLSARK